MFRPDYRRGLTDWQSIQEPPGTQRITTVDTPGSPTDPLRPASEVMRVELRQGDQTDTSGYVANRAEVFGRAATPMSTSPDRWPDPVGSERWYAISLFLPSDFQTTTDLKWIVLTQWKGLHGGSPPIALEVKRGSLRLGGARANAGLISAQDLGPVPRGTWTRIVVGVRLSTSPSDGWVQVFRDGEQKVPRTAVATMDCYNGAPDPIYLKQGIYRDSAWAVTHVAYFGPVAVGVTRAAVDPSAGQA